MISNTTPPQAVVDPDYERGGGHYYSGKISYDVDDAAAQITRYGFSQAGYGVLGTPATVSYAFRAGAPSSMPGDTGGFSVFSATQIVAAELALQSWSEVANLTFVRSGSGTSAPGAYSNSATLLFANYATGASAAAAFAYYPYDPSYGSFDSDVWINSSLWYNASPALFNYGHYAMVHEIGHALGLAHPGNYNAAPGVSITYSAHAPYAEDSRQYTVMSYFEESDTGGWNNYSYASAPLMDDIAAAQRLYGANMMTRTGDTTYGFNATAGKPWFDPAAVSGPVIFCVWDAGGNDRLDFSGYSQAALVDLRATHFSSVGGLVGNVSIAQGVTIENAITGSGSDRIIGNAASNVLEGGAGGDSLDGGARWDTLRGGDGADTLDGGLDNDQMYGGLGDDVYYVDHVGDRVKESTLGNEGNDTVYASLSWNMTSNIEAVAFSGSGHFTGVGNSLANQIAGNAGNNTFSGGAGHDTIYGFDGHDSIDGGLDSDVLDGGVGQDTLLGGQRWDTLTGGGGDDVLDGGSENDRMYGGEGNDVYYLDHIGDRVIELGGEGSDTVYAAIDWAMSPEVEALFLTAPAVSGTGNGLNNRISGNSAGNVLSGGNGNDTLGGAAGNDSLTGGTGRDNFVFASSATNGTDRIMDFAHGIDRLVFVAADYGFAPGNTLTAGEFTVGVAAVGAAAQFVWDAVTLHLYWDTDGAGGAAGVDLALIETGGVTKDDFVFV
jgi:serralysin